MKQLNNRIAKLRQNKTKVGLKVISEYGMKKYLISQNKTKVGLKGNIMLKGLKEFGLVRIRLR